MHSYSTPNPLSKSFDKKNDFENNTTVSAMVYVAEINMIL